MSATTAREDGQMHPEDPGGFDHWEPGTCESCNRETLIHWSPCADPECRGCIASCLPCQREWEAR